MTSSASAAVDKSAPLLAAFNLTRRFGGLVAVSDLSMEVWPGEIAGLIGPNGAGKSTTFNMLSGFLKPSSGRLMLFGKDCTGKSPLAISRMGLVRTFQHGSLIPSMTVRDNILLGSFHSLSGPRHRERNLRAEETAEIFGLSDYLDYMSGALPHGLQRLVGIALAFAARPRLLCLDEPLTGLNQTEVASTLEVFQTIRRSFDCSILLVEHNMKAVMTVCDRIIVMHHGQYLASGTPREIQANDDVVAAYLGKRHAKQ